MAGQIQTLQEMINQVVKGKQKVVDAHSIRCIQERTD